MATLREELERVRAVNGKITPRIVVEEARNPGSPLHDRFTWDEHENSERYLLVQARRLIRSVKIEYIAPSGRPERVRAFHAIARPDGTSYEPAEDIAQDRFAGAILLQQMEREWKSMYARYARFEEFRDLVLRDLGAA